MSIGSNYSERFRGLYFTYETTNITAVRWEKTPDTLGTPPQKRFQIKKVELKDSRVEKGGCFWFYIRLISFLEE